MSRLSLPSIHLWLLAAAVFHHAAGLQKPQLEEIRRGSNYAAARLSSHGQMVKVHHQSVNETASSLLQESPSDKTFLPPMYKSADKIIDEMGALATPGGCAVPFEANWESDEKHPQKKVFVVRMGQLGAPKNMMLVANTHAREAITAEVARSFVKWVCEGSSPAKKLLAGLRITVVPVLNLSGRRLIDDGSKPCMRSTADEGEGEIDLNRNMDVDFEPSPGHGHAPFSTYQARILRRLAVAEKPLAYLDLHSGFHSLMVPWGSKLYTTPDFPDQNRILSKVSQKFCPECKIGSNSVVIGYRNPGEIIDHMYAKEGIKYSTLWEIYDGEDQDDCLEFFNPLEQDHFDSTVKRWTGAVMSFAQDIQSTVRRGETSMPIQNVTGGMLVQIADLPMPTKDAPGAFLTT